MKKENFKKELVLANQQQRGSQNIKKEVRKIQSWLTLYELSNPGSGTAMKVDGIFGPATEIGVKQFQQIHGLPQTGIVDAALFGMLTIPLLKAFTHPSGGITLREKVVNVAKQHLEQKPFELVIDKETNSGPWVRSYMDGAEGSDMLWCMGFVQAILDQAASELNKDFRKLVPHTGSCDVVGNHGIATNRLARNINVRANPSLIQPGDIFLLYDKNNSQIAWFHTGIIISSTNDTITTIEGNTNNDGSSNGNGVYKRIRNFRTNTIDVFSIQSLV